MILERGRQSCFFVGVLIEEMVVLVSLVKAGNSLVFSELCL